MSIFEYVMVLVSIIIGLAIARMLEGILRVLRSGRPYKTYWVHSVWVVLIFFEMTWHWAYRWELQARAGWTLWEILFFILPTILLFLLAGLLFPEREATDLREYYFRHHPTFFALFIGLMAVYSIETWWILDSGLGNRGDFTRLALATLSVPLALSKRERVHVVATVAQFLVIFGVRLSVFGGSGGRFMG